MIRAITVVVLLALTLAVGQEGGSPQTAKHLPPCASHLVNGRVCLSEGVLRGFLMKYVAPKLPAGIDKAGEVVLHVVVAQTGKPVKISVLSGDPALTHSAVRAVREWIFMPYVYKGKEVEMEGDLHIPFKAQNPNENE